MPHYKKSMCFVLYILLILTLCGFTDNDSGILFDKAQQAYPLTKNGVPKGDSDKILAAYEPAAKKGNIVGMMVCMGILLGKKQYDKIYPYIEYLDDVDYENLKFREKDLQLIQRHVGHSAPNLLIHATYKLLCQLHLLGLGTEQNYTKAQHAYEQMKRAPSIFPEHYHVAEHFTNPHTLKAQKAFGRFTKGLPGAEKFIIQRIKLGENNYDIHYDIEKMFETLKFPKRLDFYNANMTESMKKSFGFNIALLHLKLDKYNSETIEKVKYYLQSYTSPVSSNKAKQLLMILPKDLQDNENLEKIGQFYRDNNLGALMPMWFYATFTNQIDQGILDVSLKKPYEYILSAREKKLITQYNASQNKSDFIAKLPKSIYQEKIYEFKFHVYKDLRKNDLKTFDLFCEKFMSHGSYSYPPLEFYVSQKMHQRALSSTSKENKNYWMTRSQIELEDAAEGGYPLAMAIIGYKMITSSEDKNDDSDIFNDRRRLIAFNDMMKAARMGNAEAFIYLTLLPNNEGDKNARDRMLVQRAEKIGIEDATAKYQLGLMYFLGDKIEKNYEKAIAYFRQSAEQGNPNAQHDLGIAYKLGDGVEKSAEKAVFWWEKAVQNGSTPALYNLGTAYIEGTGIVQDKEKGLSLLQEAADAGHSDAQKKLEELKKLGKQTTADTEKQKNIRNVEDTSKKPKARTSTTTPDSAPVTTSSAETASPVSTSEPAPTATPPVAQAELAKPVEKTASPDPAVPVAKTPPVTSAKPTEQATAPAPKKPGKAVIIPTTTDTMSLTAFAPDQKPDSCIQVVALNKSPLTAVRLESMGGTSASWKTKDVKAKAQGVLAVMQDGKVINEDDASFALDVTKETPLNLCVQDSGAISDAKTRMRVIFFHQDGSRSYSIVSK